MSTKFQVTSAIVAGSIKSPFNKTIVSSLSMVCNLWSKHKTPSINILNNSSVMK